MCAWTRATASSYLHFKDIDPAVRRRTIDERIGFYDACAAGLFCNLGDGIVDFLAFKEALSSVGFSGWGTVEQDCDPAGSRSPLEDAKANLSYLKNIGLA